MKNSATERHSAIVNSATERQLNYGKIYSFKRLLLYCSAALVLCVLMLAAPGFAAEISVVDVKIHNNDIYVTTSVKPDTKFMNDLSSGLSKELVFYIDLFRVWDILPDEFVTGRKIVRIIKSNPIKREYVASSLDGSIQLEKRFKELEMMVEWSMSIAEMKLTNIRELEPGEYFVKITVDSRIRKLPPVIGYLLFFVPEKEFSISKDSQRFRINRK